MPETNLLLFKDADGSLPLVDWLRGLHDSRVRAKCIVAIERLELLGHELRRPEADLLRDGVYELRVRWGSVNYRILYCWIGSGVALLSHGITKERRVPPREIELAVQRRALVIADQEKYSEEWGAP